MPGDSPHHTSARARRHHARSRARTYGGGPHTRTGGVPYAPSVTTRCTGGCWSVPTPVPATSWRFHRHDGFAPCPRALSLSLSLGLRSFYVVSVCSDTHSCSRLGSCLLCLPAGPSSLRHLLLLGKVTGCRIGIHFLTQVHPRPVPAQTGLSSWPMGELLC